MNIKKTLKAILYAIIITISPVNYSNVWAASVAQTQQAYSTEDLYYLSRTMWAEARGEGANGMLQVGSVILNRVKSNKYPDTIKSVCLQSRQFSVWSPRNPNYKGMLNVTSSNQSFALAEKLAKQLLIGGSINSYLRFEHKSLSKGGVVIGNHRFR